MAPRSLSFPWSDPSLSKAVLSKSGLGLVAGLALAVFAQGAIAANYEFLPCPAIDVNRIYRLDRATGEVGACQYGLKENSVKEGSVGITLCYPPGEGAGPQTPSEYSLVASHHASEGAVFRVDLRTGTMSVCYVLRETVVCTPPAK
ncbi:hypothetical protein [Methylocapsa palsarum]|uniref:Uncharacterized protein n=1 Tax=Methylocapsa palsarum TaxID=1612308 RepID=A0A1I3VS47_9HYPH|nr:hypothetical protein [Methylocapsa palsarum]SFJ98022.1 hypothetical protein SAMN05444581_10159 [Methylocapsa palsarum]